VENGLVRWEQHTQEPGDTTLGSVVIVTDGVVVVGDYALVAFDEHTGTRRWRFAPDDGYGVGLYLGVARGGLVMAGSASGRVYGVNAATGRLAWSATISEAPKTTVFEPVAGEDAVAVGYSTFGETLTGGVAVVERRSGMVRWRQPFPPAPHGAATGFGGGPVLTRDLVIAASGDGRIHAFDLRTGATRWTSPPVVRTDGRVQERDWRALALTGSLLIAGSVSGVVTTMDVRDRRERWRYAHPRGGSVGMRIAADAQSVYVPHLAGLLVALRVRDGRQRWEVGGFDEGFSWAPALAGGSAYVASSRTGLFAFPK